MDSVEQAMCDVIEMDYAQEEEVDSIVPHEDQIYNKTQNLHKPTCIYYEENNGTSTNKGENIQISNFVKTSPNKGSFLRGLDNMQPPQAID